MDTGAQARRRSRGASSPRLCSSFLAPPRHGSEHDVVHLGAGELGCLLGSVEVGADQ
jgi:hypothetical protein